MFSYPVAWTRITWLTLLLAPLSWLFRGVVAIRRRCLHGERLPVPVVVVGNISVGGTGKTPLVLWLVEQLRKAGYTPGIISRGYGGSARRPRAVLATDEAAICGDEPVLLARRSECPVWIGQDRVATARALLAANPACNVIVSDDGMQHYRLARDAEIAVVDGARGLGNGWLLPAGPLREPASRLEIVDAVVIRGTQQQPALTSRPQFVMALQPSALRPVRDGHNGHNRHNGGGRVNASHFAGLRVHALAGIGNPQQFFDTLARMGIAHTPHAYPDHHVFTAADITFGSCDAVVMTEKDAVKCEAFADDTHWALQVDAQLDDRLARIVLDVLKRLKRKT